MLLDGYFFGLGFLLALITVAAVAGVVFLIAMFIGYLRDVEKRKGREEDH